MRSPSLQRLLESGMSPEVLIRPPDPKHSRLSTWFSSRPRIGIKFDRPIQVLDLNAPGTGGRIGFHERGILTPCSRRDIFMPQVTIYCTSVCSNRARAKALLRQKGFAFTEIDVSQDPRGCDEMMRRVGSGRSVPQIFIDDQRVGGWDDLCWLESHGLLETMRTSEPVGVRPRFADHPS
jgi:glutaredoxin 3